MAGKTGNSASAGTTIKLRFFDAAGASTDVTIGSATKGTNTTWTAISGDGTTVAFESDSTNLITGDTNATQDVFVRGPGVDAATYTYDRLSRLTGVDGPDGPRTYTYDPVGNRASRVLSGASTTYAYDRADRITAAGSTSITVNANGNTTARGSDSFAYDAANRLTGATVAGLTESYAYDGEGVRFSRQVGSDPAIRYVTDVNRGLPVTIADGDRKYVWGLGLAYTVSGTAIEVYHADRLGSVRAISDASGIVSATYRTDEWGVATASTGSSTQPFGFTGEPHDASGLTYLRARYYDPSLGRFLSRDSWSGQRRAPSTANRYSYVMNNPLALRDPTGRSPVSVVLGGKKWDLKNFDDAMAQCERDLKVEISQDRRRFLHDHLGDWFLRGQEVTFDELVEMCKEVYRYLAPQAEEQPARDSQQQCSDVVNCPWDPHNIFGPGLPGPLPYPGPAPAPIPWPGWHPLPLPGPVFVP